MVPSRAGSGRQGSIHEEYRSHAMSNQVVKQKYNRKQISHGDQRSTNAFWEGSYGVSVSFQEKKRHRGAIGATAEANRRMANF